MTSDHSPVFATFQIGGVKQYASEAGLRSREGTMWGRGEVIRKKVRRVRVR